MAIPFPIIRRPLSLVDAASLLVACAEAQDASSAEVAQPEQADNRAEAWLAAALLPIVGAKELHPPEKVMGAVEQLQYTCMQLALQDACFCSIGRPAHAESHGGIEGSIAARRHRLGNTWSYNSFGDGQRGGFGSNAPWRGALSGQNSTDTEHMQAGTTSEVLTLLG